MAPARKKIEVPSMPEGQAPRSKKRPPPPPYYLPLNISLYVFLISNAIAAFLAPIQDCDEVFNFWEPTHYLDHGYGLQTWEYSPVYSIRSWLYVTIHAIVGKVASLALVSKSSQFYAIRFFLALVCAACQTRLYAAICRTLSPKIGLFFLMIVAFSPGLFHASAAFLPSSFTMYMSMLGLTAFLDWRSQKIAQGIMWFGLGAIVGWPFAGALIVPLLLAEVLVGFLSGSLGTVISGIFNGAIRCLAILAIEITVDYAFLRKFAIVPWNIVAYNIFGGDGKGPDIFGTEPWTFYIRNLLLNFNIWFIFAMSAAPLLLLQAIFRPQASKKDIPLRTFAAITPFYMWFAIFTAQPHKEERFMYPAYPFLALNAAVAIHIVLSYVGSKGSKRSNGTLLAQAKLTIVAAIVLAAINAGLLRTVGMITAYNSPLKVYEVFEQPDIFQAGDSVCFGKEWYRFPSSFFLPDGMRAKFIRSEFRGLLPGEFPDATDYPALFDGTSRIPEGMNDLNQEDPGKYVDISQCSFLVDSYFPSRDATELEPDYIHHESQWEVMSCKPFLDASQTGLIGRLIWVPDLPGLPSPLQRKWGQYCLLRRRDGGSATLPEADKRSPGAAEISIIFPANFRCRSHPINRNGRRRSDPQTDMITFCTFSQQQSILREKPSPPMIPTHNLPHVTAICLLATLTTYLLHSLWKKHRTSNSPQGDPEQKSLSPTSKFKQPTRKPGEWTPSDFKRPPAAPYLGWDVHTAEPKPYRPFRYGPKYFITMGLRSMKWDEWIELDNHYLRYHTDKARRIKERGAKCSRTAPEAMDAAMELLEELSTYLPERYPTLFRKTPTGITNLLTQETITTTAPLPEDPMQSCGRLIQDDLALMLERPDGEYYLLAGSILLAGFWRLEDKYGMRLSEIHTSGSVPGYKEKLEKGMMNFFRRLRPEDPVLRNNYFIQVDESLPWSHSIGSEDSETVSWNTAEKNRAIEHHFFRSERQSLRRLPRSGAVVFTIRTYFEPVTEVVKEPYVPGRLASAIRSWGEDVARYKGREKYGEVLLEYLDHMHEEQVAQGLEVEKEDEVRSYPF
ncbi:Alg9-like mannosyltransferase family-domain-containing protein [Aspergillus bertholletiae]|uniref:Mannosyltransferase n=1 Tax=Aspergillus bertholletiae TaxID=1226010 RepID=A0A5N7AZA5_9EURO|nr:Alg9-like mannosyltransferase family-domain-containing protein [Aspergillus bertholletiae]